VQVVHRLVHPNKSQSIRSFDMSNTQVIEMKDGAVFAGQRAWLQIKKSAGQQREWWRIVGQALLVGRKLHKADQKFSQWCKEMGFGDMDRRIRADAMWFAQSGVCPTDTSISAPTEIRRWFNEQQQTSSLPDDLKEVEVTKAVELDQRSAEKVAKVANRAKSGGEGSDQAKRQLDAMAKKHGVTPEELETASAHSAPATYFQFSPAQVEALEEVRATVLAAIPELERDGLTREAIAAVFINVANSILKEVSK
jgi:hypothetical protein